MKPLLKLITVLTFLVSCIAATTRSDNPIQEIDYSQIIDEYLKTKIIEPTVVFNNDGRKELDLLEHKLSWRKLKKGIEITIDAYIIRTTDNVTSNIVWGSTKDNVNFANQVQRVIIYKEYQLIGFVLTNAPCTGLGCHVNYQIIYDLTSRKETYFGRFRTGSEFELYDFNSDNRPDYLSKTFFGSNTQGVNTTEFVLYSQTTNGDFSKFESEEQKRFWFKHTYTASQRYLNNEKFEEEWIEKIDKNSEE